MGLSRGALVFPAVALIAAAFAFTGIAAAALGVTQILFVIFLVIWPVGRGRLWHLARVEHGHWRAGALLTSAGVPGDSCRRDREGPQTQIIALW